MSFPFCYLLFLLLCVVSPHACSSRHLSLLNKESKNELRLSGKDFSKLDEVAENTVIVLKHRRRSIFEELYPEEIQITGFEGKKSAQSFDKANSMKQYDVINLEEMDMNKGIDHKNPSSQEVSQETTKIKGRKTQARLTMESKNEDDNDENIKTEEKDVVEDVVVMDYAKPHRKPPIHNLEP